MNKTGTKKRAHSTTVVCPIVYGSVAVHLGKKSEEYSTHRWKLYIRGPNNEDLSTFIEKVAFTLHPSFAEPVREVKYAPFEVSETGWGEFEASIRIYFKDADERPLDLFHLIKLYPPGPPQLSGSLKKPAPVVSEQYDEVVFFEPTESFLQLLMTYTAKDSKQQQLAPLMIEGMPVTGTAVFDDSLDVERLAWIQDHILTEINAAKDRLVGLQTQVVAITQQRRAEQKLIKAQQAQQQNGGEGSMDGADDGNAESGFSTGNKAGAAAAGGGGTGTGGAANKSTATGAGTAGGVKAGSKAGSAGSGGVKRARPAAASAAVNSNSSNNNNISAPQQQLQQQIPIAPGSVSKKAPNTASSTAFAAPLSVAAAGAQLYQPQPMQQLPHLSQPLQQQQHQQQQQQQQQPLLTQSTFALPPSQSQLQPQYQPLPATTTTAAPAGQVLPQMGACSSLPAGVVAAPAPVTAGSGYIPAVTGYSNNGNWPLQPSQQR